MATKYEKRKKQMKASEFITEQWSQKYKKSINCSHPKGFSQKAHCAGKKKHNESVEMEMVCNDCGMCQTHGSLNEIKKGAKDSNGVTKCWTGYHAAGTKKSAVTGKQVRNCVPNESVEEAAAWKRKEGKNKKGGLNAKGVASYRRENPGSKLQTAVTTKPSKLKPGSKDAKRRKSFCARMGGNKGPMKKPNGDPTRKALALRKWNCESVEHMVDMILENMDHDKDNQAVPELKAALLARQAKLQSATDDQVYDIIDSIMTRIAKSHGMSGQKLHDMWVDQYDQVPDTWIMT
jgi:hypothetical protein